MRHDPQSRRRRATWLLLCGLLCPTIACDADPTPTRAVATTEAAQSRARFVSGEVHRYAFSWKVEGEADNGMLGDVPVRGGVNLEGTLQLRVYTHSATESLVGVSIVDLTQAELLVLGANSLHDPAVLMNTEALVTVPHDDAPRRIQVPKDTPSIYRHVVGGLLANFDLVAPADEQADRVIRTGNGLAHAHYQRSTGDGQIWTRTLGDYQRLDTLLEAPSGMQWTVDAEAKLELDDNGAPLSFASHEWVQSREESPMRASSKTDFSLQRQEVITEAPRPAPAADDYISVDLHAPPDDREAQQQIARRFAEGMTEAEMATTIASAGRGLRPSPGFLVRARGFLRGWPEQASELLPMFREAPDSRTAGFILDLLVSADNEASQAVIVEALDLEGPAAQHPDYVAHLQHLTQVRTPVPEMGALLLAIHAHAREGDDVMLRRGSLYPLGTMALGLSERDPALTARLLGLLRTELAEATEAEDIVAALAGLGNAAQPEDLRTAVSLAGHERAEVRAQVASNLRWRDPTVASDENDALFDLLGDADRFVAASALAVIGDDEAPQSIAHLCERVIAENTHPGIDGAIVNVLATRGVGDPRVGEALLALANRTEDHDQARRIRRILDGAGT